MKKKLIKGKKYRLPKSLDDFREKMYVHLIDWKWEHITKESGFKKVKYDAMLPESVVGMFPLIYPTITNDLKELKKKFAFKFHIHFNHMASSQAANINLFLPILLNQKADYVLEEFLKKRIPNFKRLAKDGNKETELYKGFRLEFWDGNSNTEKGLLGDHNARAGTDSDIAIAYYNDEEQLCLWLIEHKLTEKKFTTCGGNKTKKNKKKELCENSFSDILEDNNLCYYNYACGYNYWNITNENEKNFFVNAHKHKSCPFKGGMNQLWRNQLLGLALEKEKKYAKVYFSVVKHPDNLANQLKEAISDYKELTDNNPKFFDFTSDELVKIAEQKGDDDLKKWVKWYKELYNIK